MKLQTSLVLFCFVTTITAVISNENSFVNTKHRQKHNLKLFVFGDSYVDTGNLPKSSAGPWQPPYGITFPGKPSGRFSDGHVFTDYIAGILGTKSPITYRGWKSNEKKSIRYGMNFAYGGTGVFDTFVKQPNMTTQIDYFQQYVQQTHDMQLNSSSVAIISVAGNDYATNYIKSNNTFQDFPDLAKSIIKQLVYNIKRIRELGVRKIGITSMVPLGCLPQFTASAAYQNCSKTMNSLAELHNQMLVESVKKLNNESDDQSRIAILDVYKAFSSILQQNISTGNSKVESLLKPCCQGVSKQYQCGNIDASTKMLKYSVCGDHSSSFFWDMIHPSQQGWIAVSSYLRSSILLLV